MNRSSIQLMGPGNALVTYVLFVFTGRLYKRGKFSDVMNTNRRFGEEERELIQGFMNRVYDQFKGRVLEGRGDRIEGELVQDRGRLVGGPVVEEDEAEGFRARFEYALDAHPGIGGLVVGEHHYRDHDAG